MNDNLSPYSANQYEEGIRKTLPFYETFYAQTIDLVHHIKPNVSVWLDTGCGTGSLISRAEPVFKETQFIISDPSSNMIDQAEINLGNIPKNRLKILGCVGSENLPDIDPNKPQVITSILAHHYFNKEERNIATKRCYDLLEKSGIYITFENIYPLTEEGKNIGLERWKSYQQAQGKSPQEAEEHISRYNKSFFPISIEEHLATLSGAGFKTAELFWLSHMQAGFYALK